MPFLKNASIRTKLKIVILFASGVSVILVSAGFFTYEYLTLREIIVEDLATKADILAENTNAALAFRDSADTETVLASLSSQPRITSAAIYDLGGEMLASYTRAGLAVVFPDTIPPDGSRFSQDQLTMVKPVLLSGSRIGTIYVSMDLAGMEERFRSYGEIVIFMLIGSLVIAYFVATVLERTISRPVMSLVQTAREVSERQDFSIRASQTTNDEIGLLVAAMNVMLDRISERETNLHRANEEIRTLNEELEERVRRRTTQLERANKELEAFSYSVSHDLRAPLRHIDGFAQMLQKHNSASLDEKGLRFLETISDSAKRMGQLIDELLIFSRMGRADMRYCEVDMNGLVQEVLDELKTDLNDRRHTINSDHLPTVTGDSSMLRLVLTNLLSNAIKYTRKKEETVIHVGCKDEDERFVFFIRDNGAGFDMKYANKLFGVFQRLHRSADFDGTGIGLANVKRIVERHNGSVWGEGIVEQGAVFYFTLPKSGDHHG
ncbi:MAG: ATP-binding protein [Bacteroidota bacterium]